MEQITLPEFIETTSKSEHKKPEPPAGLAEYLRTQVSNLSQPKEIASVHQLEEYLNQHLNAILWIDLEINPKTNQLIDGAFLIDNYYWYFDSKDFYLHLYKIVAVLQKAKFLGGHNLIQFDLPQIHRLIKTHLASSNESTSDWLSFDSTSFLYALQSKTWDTLLLSCLLIPHQPSHALAKLYKANVDYNNPILDCLESRCVFELCLKSWQHLPNSLQIIIYRLLPAFSELNQRGMIASQATDSDEYFSIDYENIFDIDELMIELPEGNYEQLKKLIQDKITTHNTVINTPSNDKNGQIDQTLDTWKNLGLASFINWLRYFEKPQARRPVWISKHPVYRTSFEQAEQAFWRIQSPTEDWINKQCQDFFGFEALREGQMSIVKAVFDNQDIPLGILPTGGGKSLTFQLPALILSKYQRQLTIVISPLKALIEDQVVNLQNSLPHFANRIQYLTSGQTPEAQQSVLSGVWQGEVDILYLSPERLRTHSIRQLLRNRPPAFWVLDEAHTLSQWGTDFRPDFLRIADHIINCYDEEFSKHIHQKLEDTKNQANNSNNQKDLFETLFDKENDIDDNHHKNNDQNKDHEQNKDKSNEDIAPANEFIPPKISLVTATASARVKDDLEDELVQKLMALTDNKSMAQYGISLEELKIWRDDITAHFMPVAKDERKSKAFQILKDRQMWYQNEYPEHPEKGVAIVYLRNRKRCEEFAKDFNDQGLISASYHSKLDDGHKKKVLEDFKSHQLDVVVCTNAFGMGIDKEGIHTVIHSGVPSNLESYIQEIGRVARKGYEKGEAFMLWSEEDISFLFAQERDSRIPNTNTLKDCWTAIRPTLKKPYDEQWFPSNLLSPILQMEDTEQLNTQIRVALLALERYGLLTEKEQQPAWIVIKLLQAPSKNEMSKVASLYHQLQQLSGVGETINYPSQKLSVSDNKNNQNSTTRYHLPELALALGYSVKSLLSDLRELVKQGYALWEITVRIRLKYSHRYLKSRLNKAKLGLETLTLCLSSHHVQLDEVGQYDELEEHGFLKVNLSVMDTWLGQQKHNIKIRQDILPVFRALNIVKIRQHNARQVFISSTESTLKWCRDNQQREGWQAWLTRARSCMLELVPLFEDIILANLPDNNSSNNDATGQDFLLDDIANKTQQTPNQVLEHLEQLQKLELIELSRLDDSSDAIFFIGDNHKRSSYNEVAYRYLHKHYADRCARIHVLNHWLQESPKNQQAMIEDYFALPLQQVIEKYLSPDIDTAKPYIKDYKKSILPNYFSDTQKQIIKETSRASMVLAGAGSGKTTVVVHRVAYLLMIEEIKAEKILILAYNRLAVLEIKERLTKLVGHFAYGVTISTFHGLARMVTGLAEKDATQAQWQEVANRVSHINQERNSRRRESSARYQWIIEQAILELKERPQHYQYIMVDEFQDIDAYQYELIGLLADLQTVEESNPETNVPTSDTDTNQLKEAQQDIILQDDFEQRGYLMVVGDDDQNLYSFRGASIQFIQEFAQNYHLDSEKTYYLLANYRSANNIVNLANQYIQASLPVADRLKDEAHQSQATSVHPDQEIRQGFFKQSHGIDMASWLASDIASHLDTIKHNYSGLDNTANTTNTESIAILAPHWECFDVIQHYLEAHNIRSQRYNEGDDLLPMNSFIGKAVLVYLQENPLQVIEGKVPEVLETWRVDNGFNHLDLAWQAIKQVTENMAGCTHESVIQAIEKAQYTEQSQVVLITYHSAKGLEFDHVYLIDEYKAYQYSTNNNLETDRCRPLYVALTRAKRTLTVLHKKNSHHQLLANSVSKVAKVLELPTVIQPAFLEYHRFLALDEIRLTPKDLVLDEGRAFIKNQFVRNSWIKDDWTNLGNVFRLHKQEEIVGFYSPKGQLIADLASKLLKKSRNNQQNTIMMINYTTYLYYQTDKEWYDKAGYTGTEESHYLIVPFVKFKIKI